MMIRPIRRDDHTAWLVLWAGYCRFYGREPDDAINQHAWARLHDVATPVFGLVAEHAERGVVGLAHYVLHENMSTLTPVCYLQDLFVAPDIRGAGIGRQLIDWVLAEAKRQGWSRLYWQTKEDNATARALYDQYTPHSGFVRYAIDLTQ
jgi:GNAT superfamily N-acetyltransferase